MITIKVVDYCCIIHEIIKSEPIYFWGVSVLNDRGYIYKMQIKEINIKRGVHKYYFDNLIKAKNLESKNILIDEKTCKNLVIYFTRYVHKKSMKMLIVDYHELIG